MIHNIKRVQNILARIFCNLCNTVCFLPYKKSDMLIVNAWMNQKGDAVEHNNLGDELNFFLLGELTGKKIVNYKDVYTQKKINYVCIGSVVDSLANEDSVIWGAGMIEEDRIVRTPPKRVCAVRGPQTRRCLLSQGIDCPKIYGDPALLLPLVYPIKCNRKYEIGIVPHVDDFNDPKVKELSTQFDSVKIIKMGGYAQWTDVVDDICSCEYRISSSLHGLIIADAYNIPNVWVEFSDRVVGNGFKFYDYFQSVGRGDVVSPVRISSATSVAEIMDNKKMWHVDINIERLLSVCPFDIKPKFLNRQ